MAGASAPPPRLPVKNLDPVDHHRAVAHLHQGIGDFCIRRPHRASRRLSLAHIFLHNNNR